MASEKGTRPVRSKTNSAIEGSAGIFSRFHNLLHTTSAPTHARRDFKAKPQIMSAPEKQHIHTWLEENLATLEPPVMNKMMYGDGQLKIMYVGGPNVRSDYHLEAGEVRFEALENPLFENLCALTDVALVLGCWLICQ